MVAAVTFVDGKFEVPGIGGVGGEVHIGWPFDGEAIGMLEEIFKHKRTHILPNFKAIGVHMDELAGAFVDIEEVIGGAGYRAGYAPGESEPADKACFADPEGPVQCKHPVIWDDGRKFLGDLLGLFNGMATYAVL